MLLLLNHSESNMYHLAKFLNSELIGLLLSRYGILGIEVPDPILMTLHAMHCGLSNLQRLRPLRFCEVVGRGLSSL